MYLKYSNSNKNLYPYPEPRYFLMNETHKTNLFLSLYGLNKREGCIVITGAMGTGDTSMCRMFLEKVNRKIYSEFILNHFISEAEYLESILQNFCIKEKNTVKLSKKERLYQLIQFLLNAMKDGESALLIIDDAQKHPLPLLEQTRILSSLETQNEKLLQIILVGQNGLMQNLQSPQFKQLEQRNSIKCHPGPLKKEEIQRYIEHRLMTAGSTGGISFSPNALALIRKNSLGIPRMINLICNSARLGAYTQQTMKTTEEIVENTVGNLKLRNKETEMAMSGKAPAGLTRGNKIRMSILVPAIVAVLAGVGAMGFLISKNIMIKKSLVHKPEQELQRLQEEMAGTPEELEKKERFKLAVFYQNSGELIKAEEQYLAIIELYPMDYEIHNNLGSIYQALGDLDKAIKEYRKAILIRPDYHKARNNLGVALYEKGNLQAALREFKIILETNPKDVQCLINLGVLSKKLKHPDKARRFFEQALSIDPVNMEAHYDLAVILEESEIASAIFHFQKFLEYSGGRYASLEEEVMQRLDGLSIKPGG